MADDRGLSVPEMRALAGKAARGAGLEWGLAEEAGWAAALLHAGGQDGAGLLARVLLGWRGCASLQVAAGQWRAHAPNLPLCALHVGVALVDFCGMDQGVSPARAVQIGPVAWPGFLLPHLAQTATRLGTDVELSWRNAGTKRLVVPAGGGLSFAQSPAGAELIGLSEAEIVVRVPPQRAESGAGVRPRSPPACAYAPTGLEILRRFADETLVPASDASRRMGAGGADGD